MDLELELNIICRVCLQDGDMRSIFDLDVDEMPFTDKIMQTTSLVIEPNPDLPAQLCEKCIQELDIAYRFRMNCESSDAILQMYLDKNKSRLEEHTKLTVGIKEEESDDVNYFDDPEISDFEGISQSELTKDEHQTDFDNSSNYDQASTSQTIIMPVPDKKTLIKRFVAPVTTIAKSEATYTKPEGGDRKKHICDLCGGCYKTKTELSAHVRRHLGEKPFACDKCDKKFTVMSGLRVHLRTHSGDKPYACKHCTRPFSDFGSRNKHERTHTGERPYVCSTCGMAFALSHALKRHNLCHTGEKNHECKDCGKSFATSHNLKQHKNVHLREQGLPYKKYVRRNRRQPGSKGGTVTVNQDDDQIVQIINFNPDDISSFVGKDNDEPDHHQEDEDEEVLAVSILTQDGQKYETVEVKKNRTSNVAYVCMDPLSL